ncbi:unnamed protein product [Natator depressus]
MGELPSLWVLAALLGPGGAISCYNCTSSEGYNCTTDQATCPGTVNSCITIACIEEQGGGQGEDRVREEMQLGRPALQPVLRADGRRLPSALELNVLPGGPLQPARDHPAAQLWGPNGLQCPSCFARGSDVCVPSEVLNCTGLQTQCIQFAATAGQVPGGRPAGRFEGLRVAFMGCATRSLCDVGAVALFAPQRQAVLKTNTCSAGGAARGGLPLLGLGGLLLWALRP